MNERVARGCVAAGALLVGVAPFLTWIVIGDPFGFQTGGRNLWQWQTGAGSGPLVAAPVVLAAAVLLGALLRWRWWVRRLAVTTALLAGVWFALIDWSSYEYASDGWSQVRPGAWVGLVGAVLLLAGALAMPRVASPPRSHAWRWRRWLLACVVAATLAVPIAVARAERQPGFSCPSHPQPHARHTCFSLTGGTYLEVTAAPQTTSLGTVRGSVGGGRLRPWALAGWTALALATAAFATTLSARTQRA